MWHPLADTLLQLIDAVTPDESTGLLVERASLEIPLEARGVSRNGQLLFLGSVPHSRWVAGFLPPVHLVRIEVGEFIDPEAPIAQR